ncbi:MAG: hypothetical protein KKG59_04190, partial [Nanoarchaeota archaeon]|nr:hypothetical protein [Nanoarchaeota archaeon]
DITGVFKQKLETQALRTLGKYDVNYIFFSETYLQDHDLPVFLEDEKCFMPIIDQKQKIYKIECELV